MQQQQSRISNEDAQTLLALTSDGGETFIDLVRILLGMPNLVRESVKRLENYGLVRERKHVLRLTRKGRRFHRLLLRDPAGYVERAPKDDNEVALDAALDRLCLQQGDRLEL
jgi:DNA-binding MarR family transcriptional regulator